jgi:hypothetical protein
LSAGRSAGKITPALINTVKPALASNSQKVRLMLISPDRKCLEIISWKYLSHVSDHCKDHHPARLSRLRLLVVESPLL